MIFRWRNDPFILSHGSSNRAVSWTEHEKWFEETMEGRARKMYIVLNQNVPIGQIRFDRHNGQDCIVSVYLLREFTGQGWGVQAILEGCRLIFEAWNVGRIVACVRSDNRGGNSAFLKAGFQAAEADLCPANHHCLILRRASVTRLND